MKEQGLYQKYIISRVDGKEILPTEEYFVLRLDSDGEPNHVKACRKAILVYADEIGEELPQLAKDIREEYKLFG